ncbi:helix-turn-helix domain-containing protein [Arenibacter latericius]|uniref:helix-turn-helix domain-containing protein n=1 Tax=Arenibacter latericius TaxID=86104 RepID=UPI0003FC4E96|nr:helix-turn-helix domain-containing protein [Arenibacter latericius]MDX1363378.1 helix-turn-helix domain-containing protein [Arenibacter latericius]
METLSDFVKARRKEVNLTQQEFAERSGVALTVIRKIEQGKTNLNMEKVNLVLSMFGHTLAAVPISKTNEL